MYVYVGDELTGGLNVLRIAQISNRVYSYYVYARGTVFFFAGLKSNRCYYYYYYYHDYSNIYVEIYYIFSRTYLYNNNIREEFTL